MTCKTSLIYGLIVALPIAVPHPAQGANSSNSAAAPAATSATASTNGLPSSWKRSDPATSVDIRFKKPAGIVFTDLPEEPSRDSTTIASMPAVAPAAAAATAPPQAPVLAPISAPIAANSPQTSPAPDQSQAAAVPAAAAPTAAPAKTADATAAPASAPRADDQIQLVAQLLMDRGVVRAADEEPLPDSPDAVDTNGHANHGDNGNNQSVNGEGCYDNCCPPPPCLFWVGGVEATFLSPDLNTSGVAFEVEEIDDQRDDVFSTQSTDTDSLYMSPRIWLGVQGCCWGVNLRYWHLQASEGQYDPSIGSLGGWDEFDCGKTDVGFFTSSRLEAYTVDLELTRRFCLNNCWMQASAGVRHAELWADEGITGLALTDEGLLNGFARANRMSRGTGFLLGLYGRKPIFPCSCVHWFYNARWSALWGPTQTSTETFAAVQASDPNFVASAASVNGAYTTIDDTMFIGEIQLGLEWDYCLCCLPANAFFRVAVEYQRWDGGRGFSASDSFAGVTINQGVDPTSIVTTTASADSPQMDLLGFTIGTGLTW